MPTPSHLEPESTDQHSQQTSTSTRPDTKTTTTQWRWHDQSFHDVLGDEPSIGLVYESSYPFAHEAGVYFTCSDELFITSNRLQDGDSQSVQISKMTFGRSPSKALSAVQEEIEGNSIHMANGGANYRDGVLFCAQGSRWSPSGLYWMARAAPYRTTPLLTDYHGVPFNSINDVIISKVDGGIWFTDPPYGSEQGYKDAPRLPAQVYCYYPRGGQFDIIRAVADGFGHPNGLCFSPDESILYVTDTDKVHGSGGIFPDRPSSIYAFDIMRREGQPFVCNRRLFAYVETGIPDGIKCDVAGRVYSGCGDGIHVWSSSGLLLGRIQIPGGVANFCFGRPGEIFALNETRLWKVSLAPGISGAMLADLQVQETDRGIMGQLVRRMSTLVRKLC